jgi:hypothetical protein
MTNKNEARWTTVFNQYLREKKLYGFFELKHTVLEYLPFSKIEAVQYDGLQATAKSGLVWKLSDQDMREKPCDTLSIPPLPSYVVIKFIDGFYLIDITDIVKMREDGEIAISRSKAEQIAKKIIKVELKKKKDYEEE